MAENEQINVNVAEAQEVAPKGKRNFKDKKQNDRRERSNVSCW